MKVLRNLVVAALVGFPSLAALAEVEGVNVGASIGAKKADALSYSQVKY